MLRPYPVSESAQADFVPFQARIHPPAIHPPAIHPPANKNGMTLADAGQEIDGPAANCPPHHP